MAGNLNHSRKILLFMANFCGGGDFHSLPLENRNRSFSQDGTGMRREPQGVSQWGRQQLSDSSAPGSSSSTSSSRGRGGGGGGGGFHSENCPPSKVAIQDLSPHMANTVRKVQCTTMSTFNVIHCM